MTTSTSNSSSRDHVNGQEPCWESFDFDHTNVTKEEELEFERKSINREETKGLQVFDKLVGKIVETDLRFNSSG